MSIEQQGEHLTTLSRREVLEQQSPADLMELRSMLLSHYSDLEADIHLVNDVLENGYGVLPLPTVLDMPAYDAVDGTTGSPEHPEDSKWIHRSEN